VAGSLRVAWFVQAALLLSAWPLVAQVRVGETSTSLSGNIASGYTADYGNMTSSDHSWTVGGNATASGAFYNPNFLSYNANVYFNQSQANSNFQSISDASGVNITTNIFGGSHFPGSFTYSKAYNSEGNYSLPGIANYVTHGNNDNIGFNWNENLPDAPSFSVGFQTGNSQYSVYGTSDQGKNAFHSLNLHSGYSVAGFNMSAYYVTGGGHSVIPQVVAGQQIAETHQDNSAEGFNVQHMLPLHGSASAGFNRSEWNTNYLGFKSSGSIDTINALAAVHPLNSLSISANANYSDNLSGQLYQSVISAGGLVPGPNSDSKSDSLDLMVIGSYTPLQNFQTSLFFERRTQSFLGEDFGVTSYGGGASYGHRVYNGNFNSSLSVTANSADKTGADTLGLSTTENYTTEVMGWHLNGSFAYTQNAQTLLVTYMNSFFNYSGNARRRWGRFNIGMGAGAGRTALTQQAGTSNSSQSYNASAGFGQWINATGSYSKADGQALATGGGLVPVPVPSPTIPSSLVSLYGGNSTSFGLSSAPVKNFIIAATYSKSTSNTSVDALTSANKTDQFNTLMQYQFRKLNFVSGYARLEQGFSVSGTQPEVISSFYIGVSRWFNFF